MGETLQKKKKIECGGGDIYVYYVVSSDKKNRIIEETCNIYCLALQKAIFAAKANTQYINTKTDYSNISLTLVSDTQVK